LRHPGVWLAVSDVPGWSATRRQRTRNQLLDGVESGNHAHGRLDLQHGRSLNQRLPSPRTNFQTILQVTLIPGDCHRGGVCRNMQGVQYLGVGDGSGGLAVG
jgi:hypothetical protein